MIYSLVRAPVIELELQNIIIEIRESALATKDVALQIQTLYRLVRTMARNLANFSYGTLTSPTFVVPVAP